MPEAVESFTAEQLQDLGKLLSEYVTRGNLLHFGTLALGKDITIDARNELNEPLPLARKVVQVLSEAGKLWELIAKIREQAHQNSQLAIKLSRVINEEPLNSSDNLQALYDETLPLFRSDRMNEIGRALCAIGLGEGVNKIVGSGFLVGPDLVLTNYHVLKNYLKVDAATGKVAENGAGDQIFCFFDYVSQPAPMVPPIEGRAQRYVTVKALPAGWLRCGRVDLANDGDDGVKAQNNEYDYVLFQLDRDVGNAPAAPSGGEPRGWLTLPSSIDPFGIQRLLLVQHAGGYPQSFDVGEFDSLNDQTSRVRYRLNSERGSSGSPAVGQEGVFALHNGAVRLKRADGRELNQGVRIDYIVQDLAQVAGWPPAKQAAAAPSVRFWSLNENFRSSRPILGRVKFMDHVHAMRGDAAERVLTVYGPEGSGRRFSVDLLRRYLGSGVPVATFTGKELEEFKPPAFLENLVKQLGVFGAGDVKIPDENPHEDLPQWLRKDLPGWLLGRLTADAARTPLRYPAWVVIDLVTVPAPSTWATHLSDFLAGLLGAHDTGQTPVDIPQLRWLVLGPTADPLPLTGVNRRAEDLKDQPTLDDVAECLSLAWRSLGYPHVTWDATQVEALLEDKDIYIDDAPRRQLAEVVARLVLKAPKRRK